MTASHRDEGKIAEIRKLFKKLDKSGDGSLDFKELSVILRRGNPGMSDKELRILYEGVDKNNDGRISFDEFLEFIFDQEDGDDEDPAAPPAVKDIYDAYCNGKSSMDSSTFMKLIKECRLIDSKFATHDVDMIFASVKVKGERQIDYDQFQKALGMVARRKKLELDDIHDIVGASAGPQKHATQARGPVFRTDSLCESTNPTPCSYVPHTGSESQQVRSITRPRDGGPAGGAMRRRASSPTPGHRYDSPLEKRGGLPPEPEHDVRQHRSSGPTKVNRHQTGPTKEEILDFSSVCELSDWVVSSCYSSYAAKDGVIDGREWSKFCKDTKVCNPTDADLVFSYVVKGERKITNSEDFKKLLAAAANRRGMPIKEIESLAAKGMAGPKIHGTQAREMNQRFAR